MPAIVVTMAVIVMVMIILMMVIVVVMPLIMVMVTVLVVVMVQQADLHEREIENRGRNGGDEAVGRGQEKGEGEFHELFGLGFGRRLSRLPMQRGPPGPIHSSQSKQKRGG